MVPSLSYGCEGGVGQSDRSRFEFRLAGWRAWDSARAESETPSAVPLSLRRRVSPVGQKALRAAWSFPEIATARLILASRHGEFGRTLSILDDLGKAQPVSPADFTLSVHNALVGLLSIAAANRRGHTAIAAGAETFGFGLIEAAACLAESPDEPVVLIYFDEPLPGPYAEFNETDAQPMALARIMHNISQ
jgi:hypothetical protein